MKSKRIWVTVSLVFLLIAVCSLSTEMFVAYLEDAAAFGEHYATGFNLPEFSPLGFIPILTPIVLILLMYAKLPYTTGVKALFTVAMVNAVSFNHALIALHGEMLGPVKWIVHLRWGIPVYMLAIILAEIAIFMSMYLSHHKSSEALTAESTPKPTTQN